MSVNLHKNTQKNESNSNNQGTVTMTSRVAKKLRYLVTSGVTSLLLHEPKTSQKSYLQGGGGTKDERKCAGRCPKSLAICQLWKKVRISLQCPSRDSASMAVQEALACNYLQQCFFAVSDPIIRDPQLIFHVNSEPLSTALLQRQRKFTGVPQGAQKLIITEPENQQ